MRKSVITCRRLEPIPPATRVILANGLRLRTDTAAGLEAVASGADSELAWASDTGGLYFGVGGGPDEATFRRADLVPRMIVANAAQSFPTTVADATLTATGTSFAYTQTGQAITHYNGHGVPMALVTISDTGLTAGDRQGISVLDTQRVLGTAISTGALDVSVLVYMWGLGGPGRQTGHTTQTISMDSAATGALTVQHVGLGTGLGRSVV